MLAAAAFGLLVGGATRQHAGSVPAMPEAKAGFVRVCGARFHFADPFPAVFSTEVPRLSVCVAAFDRTHTFGAVLEAQTSCLADRLAASRDANHSSVVF